MSEIWRLFTRYGINRRFWKHADVGAPGECWPWRGPARPDGAPEYDGGPACAKAYELAAAPCRRERRCATTAATPPA